MVEESATINQKDLDQKTLLYDVLSSFRRRYTIRYLETERTTDIEELTENLVSIQFGEYSSDEKKRIYVSLYQTHLSYLKSEDIIEFNEETGEVRAISGEVFDQAIHYIDKADFFKRDGSYGDISAWFHVASKERSLLAFSVLHDRNSAMTLNELARNIVARQNGISTDEISDRDRKSMYVALYQTHIPRLEDIGIVDFDEDEGQVTLQNKTGFMYYLVYNEFPSYKTKLSWLKWRLQENKDLTTFASKLLK